MSERLATGSNTELVLGFLAAMGRMDIGSLHDMMTEDVTWWLAGDLPVSGTHTGRAEVMDGFLSSAAALFEPGSLGFELRGTTGDGETVVAEYAGSGRGAMGGATYGNSYCTVFECRDGKIAAVREYLDTAHVCDVLYPAGV